MGPEAKIEKAVSDFARKLGWLVYKFTSPGNVAVPDRMFMRSGRMFFIEFKAPGKKATTRQEWEHTRILTAGFETYVIDNVDAGESLLRRMDGERVY